MRKVLIVFGFLISLQFQSIAQGASILAFFDNIFNISGLIENENRERLQRELNYFAKSTDELIRIKKNTTSELLSYCKGNSPENFALRTNMEAFNEKVEETVKNLESIRRNVLFESDYDIIVDTFYEATLVENPLLVQLDSGCYLQKDTNYIKEEFAPEGFNPVSQMELPESMIITDSVVVLNMYCPQIKNQKKSKHGWKTISFSDLVEGFQYSLNTKSRNIEFLRQNCNKKLIVEERDKAVKALQEMRNKALELKKNLKED